jgi:hypothetical protein
MNTTYIIDSTHGAGGFLNPPQHAEHNYSIIGKERGREVESMSLSYAVTAEYVPAHIRQRAQEILEQNPGVITEEWIISTYKYFGHTYSPDGIERNVSKAIYYGKFWGNADKEKDANPEHHLAYLFIKTFDPNHTPRLDLMGK